MLGAFIMSAIVSRETCNTKRAVVTHNRVAATRFLVSFNVEN